MTGTNRHDRLMLMTDLVFGFFAIAGPAILVSRSFASAASRPEAIDPLVLAGLTIGIVLAAVLAVVLIAELERRCGEDYRWQLITRSAFAAALTAILYNALAEDFLLGRWIGAPGGNTLFGVLVGSWAVAYFAARIKAARQ